MVLDILQIFTNYNLEFLVGGFEGPFKFTDPLIIHRPPFDPLHIHRPLGCSHRPLGVDIDHFGNPWARVMTDLLTLSSEYRYPVIRFINGWTDRQTRWGNFYSLCPFEGGRLLKPLKE